MARHLFFLTAALLATAGSAAAQYPYPYQQPGYANPPGGMAGPPLSPYLNLLNGGNPAVNYYNFVRPQLALQQPALYGGGGGAPLLGEFPLASVLPTTDWTARIPRPSGTVGNPAAYMAYGAYFNSMGTIGSAARGQPAAVRPGQQAVPNVPRR